MGHSVAGKLVLGAAAAAGAAALGFLIARPESQLLGTTVVAGDDPNEIALTYDDGPNECSTLALLEVLARFDARATFFMIGAFVQQRPEIVREVDRAGHLIGNHTMTHPFLANKPEAVIEDEIRRCNLALEDALGASVRYFRAPYGARRPAVLRLARKLGLEPVQWNVQGNDWKPLGASQILHRLERGIRRVERSGRGANILLHDGFHGQMGWDRSDTVRVTKFLIAKAHARGKRFVGVDAWEPERSHPDGGEADPLNM